MRTKAGAAEGKDKGELGAGKGPSWQTKASWERARPSWPTRTSWMASWRTATRRRREGRVSGDEAAGYRGAGLPDPLYGRPSWDRLGH